MCTVCFLWMSINWITRRSFFLVRNNLQSDLCMNAHCAMSAAFQLCSVWINISNEINLCSFMFFAVRHKSPWTLLIKQNVSIYFFFFLLILNALDSQIKKKPSERRRKMVKCVCSQTTTELLRYLVSFHMRIKKRHTQKKANIPLHQGLVTFDGESVTQKSSKLN